MEKGESIRKELEEAERQSRGLDVEIQRMAQQTPKLEEAARVAEQKNIQEQTKLGRDPVDIQPSRMEREAIKRLEDHRKTLEKFQQRKVQTSDRIEQLQMALLEDELVQQAHLFTSLKKRETDLEEALVELRNEIQTVEKHKESLALRLVQMSEKPN